MNRLKLIMFDVDNCPSLPTLSGVNALWLSDRRLKLLDNLSFFNVPLATNYARMQ